MPLDARDCFESFRGHVYRWALALCGRHDDALDTVQDVFVRLLRSRPVLETPPQALGWLRRAAASAAIDRWRRARGGTRGAAAGVGERSRTRAPADRDLVDERVATPAALVESREDRERLRAALADLSEQQRLVLVCKSYDAMSFAEIAEELGVTVSTVKTHYLRGLTALRDALRAPRAEPSPLPAASAPGRALP